MVFREVQRAGRSLSQEDCIAVLKSEPRGILSVLGDGGYPYGLPIDHWYCEEDGKLYFHCGKTGHKIDAIRRCDKVSYCVCGQGYRKEGDWALTFQSVVVFGRAKILENQEKAIEITRRLSYQFTTDADFIEQEIRQSGANVLVFSLTPEHITGKLVHEA